MKRCLSAVLALAMLISLLPAVSAGESEGITITYDIHSFITATTEDMSIITEGATNGFFRFNSGTGGKIRHRGTATNRCIDVYSGKYLILDVYVPVAGTYTMSGLHPHFTSGGVTKVYINGSETEAGSYDSTPDAEKHPKPQGANSYGYNEEFIIEGISLNKGWNSFKFEAVGGIGTVKTFTISNGPGKAAMKSTATISATALRTGKTAQITVTSLMSDGTYEEDTNVSFSSSDDNVAMVDANGKITAVGAGNATVTVSGSALAEPEEFDIVVTEPNWSGITIKYDLCTVIVKNKVSAVGMLTEDITNKFFRNNSESSASGIRFRNNRGTVTNNCIEITDASVVLDVYVPVAGDYVMSGTNPHFQSGGSVEVYINGSDEKVGSYDCSGGSETNTGSYGNDTSFEFSGVSMQKGWNTIKFTAVTPGRQGTVKTFTLDGGDGSVPMDVALGANNTEIEITEKAQITATVYMSDGETVVDDTVEYSVENETVATVDSYGRLTGKAVGTATVRVTGGMANADETIDINVIVAPLGTGQLLYDMTPEGIAGGTMLNTITYAETGDAWAYFANKNSNEKYMSLNTTYSYLSLAAYGGKNGWVALKINVPEAGKYGISQSVGKRPAGASQIGMYILPGNTERNKISDIIAAGTGLVTDNISCHGASITQASESFAGTYNFKTAGEYIVVYKQLSGESNPSMYIGDIRLDGNNIISEIDVSVDKTNVKWNETANISAIVRKLDKSALQAGEYTISYSSSDDRIATVDAKGTVVGTGNGDVVITIKASDGTRTVIKKINFNVFDHTGVTEPFIKISDRLYQREAATFGFFVRMGSGNEYELPFDKATYEIYPDGMVTIEDGIITVAPDAEGEVTITGTAPFRDEEYEFEKTIEILVDDGKTKPTYYTPEMRANAMNNIKKYNWAKSTRDSAVSKGDSYLNGYELLLLQMTGEGIPRSRQMGMVGDNDYYFCRYCGFDIVTAYGSNGSGGWSTSFRNRPWKVQCPDCKRIFPSNDFESFHKLGLLENGNWDRQKALEVHRAMLIEKGLLTDSGEEAPTEERSDAWYKYYGYGVAGGYLYNDLYSELRDPAKPETYNKDPFKKDADGNYYAVDGNRWGVDDGYGYYPGRKTAEGEENHCYIPYYNYFFWSHVENTIELFTSAYLYTEDLRYARAGAILLDRAADLWPSFDLYTNWNTYVNDEGKTKVKRVWVNTDGGSGRGKIVGRINDCLTAKAFVFAADAFFPMLTDGEFLHSMEAINPERNSSQKIWENWKQNILLETWDGLKTGKINGNFGMAQEPLAAAAIVLDEEPERSEMLRWLYAPNTGDDKGNITGGNFLAAMVNSVDRDGMSNESSPSYGFIWLSRLYGMAESLSKYNGEDEYNIYENPKFARMYSTALRIALTGDHHAQIGDSGTVAGVEFFQSDSIYKSAFKNLKDTVYGENLARYLWLRNGKTAEGLNYGIFHEDPEILEDEVMERIAEDYEQESDMMPGYGFAVLRAGRNYTSANSSDATNNQRDFWIYFGSGETSHAHKDVLNLGIEAFGLNISPEMGYPAATGSDPHRGQWVSATISHNTVVVDEANTQTFRSGYPYHFDSTENVKLFDVDAANAYAQTEDFRRSLVMVKVNDDISYGIDFFHVLGGNKHTYSLHALSDNAVGVLGLDLVHDEVVQDKNGNDIVGTYAGADVPLGKDPGTENGVLEYPRGYTWMYDVRRDTEAEKNFSVDFAITDWRKTVTNNKDLHMRVTQLNEFIPDEVAITKGVIPQKKENSALPKGLEYLLVSREGENLDTLFTTVIEPYRKDRYIESIEALTVDGVEASDTSVKAIKVTHTGAGRTDYIVYSMDNSKLLTIRDIDGSVALTFRGFVGVVTKNASGAVIYRYVNDGDEISGATEKPGSFSGTVEAFQREFGAENYIDVVFDGEADLSDIVGRYVNVDNGSGEGSDRFNGVYLIEGYTDNREVDGTVRLDIGTVTLINSYRDIRNTDIGYNYNIDVGQSFVIPMSYEENFTPVFDDVSDNITTSAGSSVSVTVNAESPITDNPPAITYSAATFPRGASVDSLTGTVTWKPDASQIGGNHFAITARDADGRESTVHFNITVYGSTTGGKNQLTETPGAETTDTPSAGGGGGGGGGGAAPTDTPENDVGTEQTDTSDKTETETTAPDTSGETDNIRFTDLGNHAWAEDAINTLAQNGIIRGTTSDTYSPANNITRADFASLLVRAFELSSDNTENFADVSANDYFATELAIARNNGIISGIGDNKFAPRNTITRQDMMVIVYRALQKLNVGFSDFDEPQYHDFSTVAPYAQDAVSALIGAGLVNGKNKLIAPTDYTTRAEVAVLIKRILDYTKK